MHATDLSDNNFIGDWECEPHCLLGSRRRRGLSARCWGLTVSPHARRVASRFIRKSLVSSQDNPVHDLTQSLRLLGCLNISTCSLLYSTSQWNASSLSSASLKRQSFPRVIVNRRPAPAINNLTDKETHALRHYHQDPRCRTHPSLFSSNNVLPFPQLPVDQLPNSSSSTRLRPREALISLISSPRALIPEPRRLGARLQAAVAWSCRSSHLLQDPYLFICS